MRCESVLRPALDHDGLGYGGEVIVPNFPLLRARLRRWIVVRTSVRRR